MTRDHHTAAIELLRPHRHGGRDYPAGARLRLLPDQADWLCALAYAAVVVNNVVRWRALRGSRA